MKTSMRGVTLLVAGAGVAAACASAAVPPGPRTLAPLSCVGFTVQPSTITVPAGGGTFDIQPQHRLIFMPGAVPAGSTYEVREGDRGGAPDHWLQIDIDPVGTAPREFEADVFLDLGYAGCPDLMSQTARFVVAETEAELVSIGGRDTKAPDFYVHALLPHLTMFAIAN